MARRARRAGADEHKPFLDVAPWLIVAFARIYHVRGDGATVKHSYVQESVGIVTDVDGALLDEERYWCSTYIQPPNETSLGRPTSAIVKQGEAVFRLLRPRPQ